MGQVQHRNLQKKSDSKSKKNRNPTKKKQITHLSDPFSLGICRMPPKKKAGCPTGTPSKLRGVEPGL
jgi:hypothetical protein